MLFQVILIGIVITLLLVYQLRRYNESYWKKRGVKFHRKNKVTGPFWDFVVKRRPMFQILSELYKEYRNEPAVGVGGLVTPTLFVIDHRNVQHVLQADFQSFSHRGIEAPRGDQLADSVIFMNGPRWKLMRQNMSPLFTASKLKNMYYIMDKSAQDFVDHLRNNPKSWEGDFFNTVTTFCSAAVCAAIFGINTGSTFDSPFLKMARALQIPTLKNALKFAIASVSINLTNALGLTIFKEYEEFFTGAITKVIKNRDEENIKRHDFADICVSLQKKGTMIDETNNYRIEPTYGILAAQAMFFIVAGVDPCANAIFVTLIELGLHKDMLEKVHQEIDETFVKYNGNLTYDAISEMEYLDKVLSEAMRMYPPVAFLTRQCVRDSVLPVGDIFVEKGTKIMTPIYDIHHDPKLYTNPDVFDPERFSKERKPSDDIYMPFGLGNRMCIGARYAKLQVMAGLVHVLRHFTVKTKQSGDEIKYALHQINVRPDNVDIELIPRTVK